MRYTHLFEEQLAQDIYRKFYDLPDELRQYISAEFIFSLEESFSYRRPPADRDVAAESEVFAMMILSVYMENVLDDEQMKPLLKENHLSEGEGAELYQRLKASLLKYFPATLPGKRKYEQFAWPESRLIFRIGKGYEYNSPIPAKGMQHDYKEEVLLAVPGTEIELSGDFNRKVVFGDYVTDGKGTVTGIRCRIEYGELTRKFLGLKEDQEQFAELKIGMPYHFSDTGYEDGSHYNHYQHYVLEKQIS